MVKGSNSLKNKKLHSSKPYDVSNSFVRKVTSHVTNLLPQPAWLSKWFTYTEDGESQRRETLNSNDSGSEEDDDIPDETAPPTKRAKIPLNQQFPPNSFKISPIINDEVPSQRAGPSRIHPNNFVTDGAVAGPSGINTRQQRVSSTPNVQSPATNLLSNTERKLNGDDQSESSESTSGCSSLVPQANRQFQASETVTNNLSARRRSIDEKLNFTGHLQSPRSLFSDRSYSRSPRLNSSLSQRRPSFNVSTFGSPVLTKDKISIQNKIVNSPFYAGKTTYGGAAAYRRTRDGFPFHNEALTTTKRYGVQVKPVNCESDSLSSMSATARRILEALEQFSSPVLDAKRIPVQSPSTPLSNKRKRPLEMGQSPGLRTGQAPRTPNSVKPLIIPTVPDLLKMKRREMLQDSMEAARLIAVSSAETPAMSCPITRNQGYRLRFGDEEKSGRHGGKIRSKEKELEEETVEEINLPNVPLPVTSLPKFDFVVPPAVSTPSVVSTFKFASPITVTENARTCLPVDNFTFSKPLSIGSKDSLRNSSKKNNCIDTSIPNCPTKLSELQFKSGSDNKLVSSRKEDSKSVSHKINSQNSDVCFGIKPAAELKTGSVMDILGKMSNSVDKGDSKEVSSNSNISLDKFKLAPGMWECSACLIRNQSDAKKCVCCETPRATVPTQTSATTSSSEKWECSSCHTSNTVSATSCSKCSTVRGNLASSQMKNASLPQEKSKPLAGFGSSFKPASNTWECTTCLVRNPDSATQCQACETKRPGLANSKLPATPVTFSSTPTSNTGFGEKFKKPEGSWDCPDCMLQNKSDSLKCIACERAKPGTETKTSTIKFNFAIPAEASGFKFGIDKAGEAAKESVLPKPSTDGFKFGESKVTAASTFSFGVSTTASSLLKSSAGVATTSVVSTPAFNFGTTTFSSPTSNTSVKSAENTSAPQPVFNFSIPQPSKFASPVSNDDKKQTGEVPKKRRASDAEVAVDSKVSSLKEPEGSSSTIKAPATSSDSGTVTKQKEEKSENKERPAKKVTFSFGSSAPSFVNEKPNTSTKTADTAKPSFSFGASSAGLNFNSAKPVFSFVGSSNATGSTVFGNSVPPTTTVAVTTTAVSSTTTAPADTTSTATTTATTVASTTSSNLFTFGSPKSPSFGSGSSGHGFGQSSVTTTTPSTNSFVAALKTTSPASTFSFTAPSKPFGVSNKESVSVSTPKTQTTTFGLSTAVTAFGGSTTTTTTTTTASSITSPSLPSFATATTTPSFSLGGRGTIPAFGTPSTAAAATATTTSTATATTTPVGFGNVAAPNFSTGFSSLGDQNKQDPSKSVTGPAPFSFGSNTSNTSSLGTASPFSFGNVQSDQGLANKGTFSFGAPASSTAGSTSTPASNTGFGFGSNNPTPAFSFGSSSTPTPNSAAPSLFGSATNSAPAPAPSGPIFGGVPAAAGTFGATNPNAGGSSSTSFNPTFTFGAATQPSPAVFGFNANQPAGSASTPGPSFAPTTPNFNFGQTQPSAQAPPTFNPNVKPSFNFTKGETPTFTAAAPPVSSPAASARRIKKAVRRTHPR